MLFVLYKMPALLLQAILASHLFYGHRTIMVTTETSHVIRTSIEQTFLHSIPPFRQRFTIELPTLYIINFVLSRFLILNFFNILSLFKRDSVWFKSFFFIIIHLPKHMNSFILIKDSSYSDHVSNNP